MSLKVDVVARHVGKRLQRRRQLLGMSKKQLAAMASTHSMQIKRYECGEGSMTAGRLHQFATALAVSPNYFFDGLRSKAPLTALISQRAACKPDPKLQEEVLVLLGAYQRLAERPRQRFLALAKMLSEPPRERVSTPRARKSAAPSTADASGRDRTRT